MAKVIMGKDTMMGEEANKLIHEGWEWTAVPQQSVHHVALKGESNLSLNVGKSSERSRYARFS